jgi:hypothetical protein
MPNVKQYNIIQYSFKKYVVFCALCVMLLLLAACGDSDNGDNTPTPTPPVTTSSVTGQWTAAETFSSSNDSTTVVGEVTFRMTIEENAGVIATNINALNEVLIILEQPISMIIERRRQGDPSFVTGTFNGDQVVLEVDIGNAIQSASLLIEGTLQNDDTITGEARLQLFGVTATSPITMNKQ